MSRCVVKSSLCEDNAILIMMRFGPQILSNLIETRQPTDNGGVHSFPLYEAVTSQILDIGKPTYCGELLNRRRQTSDLYWTLRMAIYLVFPVRHLGT